MADFHVSYHDFYEEDDFDLIAINTSLANYKLAYLINKFSHLNFKRTSYDVNNNKNISNVSFVLYEYMDVTYECEWFLIQNKCKVQSESYGIFQEAQETQHYLIPEFKNVDFFVKVEGCSSSKIIEKQISILSTLPLVSTAYIIDKKKLKSKEAIIF